MKSYEDEASNKHDLYGLRHDNSVEDLHVADYDLEKYTNIGLVLPDMRYQVLQPRVKRPARLRCNWQTAVLFSLILNRKFIVEAVPLTRQRISNLAFGIRDYARNFSESEKQITMYSLATNVEHLASLDDYAIIYSVDRIVGISDLHKISTTLREELTHWKQNYFGIGSDKGDQIAFGVSQYPSWNRIRERLLLHDYSDKPSLLVAEAGAKAAAGDYEPLGLTSTEAQEFLSFYYLQIIKAKGVDVADQIIQFANRTEVLRLHEIGKTDVTDRD